MSVRSPGYNQFLYDLAHGDLWLMRLLDMLLPKFFREHEIRINNSFTENFFINPGKVDLLEDIKKIRNWLKAAIANDEAWLFKCDYKGAPYLFGRFKNVDAIFRRMGRDNTARKNKIQTLFNDEAVRGKRRAQLAAEGHVDIIRDFGEAGCFVRNRTPFALDRETHFIGNCIGIGWYDANLKWDGYAYYSAWDKNDIPHVSMEVIDGAIAQCAGKQNKPPIMKYLPSILTVANDAGWGLNGQPSKTGLIKSARGLMALNAG